MHMDKIQKQDLSEQILSGSCENPIKHNWVTGKKESQRF